MGGVIGKNAAGPDQISDAKATLRQAAARALEGDPRWLAPAEARLARPVALWDSRQAALVLVEEEVKRLRAVLAVTDDITDQFVVVLRETLWNAAGRPGPNGDPSLELLFPDGSDTYAEETLDGTADALDFLAELLRTAGHPLIAGDVLERHAAEVAAHAARHRSASDALRKPLARQRLLGKASTALARSARMQLVKLKRTYELDGHSAADIHAVIPDRSEPAAKKPAPAPLVA